MKKSKNIISTVSVFLIVTFSVALITEPQVCSKGVASGILLCGRVIIPSLFPFTVCVLFVLKSGIFRNIEKVSHVTKRLFGVPSELFWLVMLSFIGGYPIGARLLNEAVVMKKITPKTAGIMLCYCVNAGPAFVVSAVGSGIIGSKRIGYILLLSNISAAFVIAFLLRKMVNINLALSKPVLYINPADNFVMSTTQAATSVMSICGFVILFSGLNQYIMQLSEKIIAFKPVLYLLEVTNAVANTGNIYIISFLLGFGGISVWCQVLAMSEKIEINYLSFVLARLFHAALSCGVTFLMLRVFKITVPAISNLKSFDFGTFTSSAAVGISMLVMSIVFIISLGTKKYAGKIIDNMV